MLEPAQRLGIGTAPAAFRWISVLRVHRAGCRLLCQLLSSGAGRGDKHIQHGYFECAEGPWLQEPALPAAVELQGRQARCADAERPLRYRAGRGRSVLT
jgi:hypothetical protein